MLMNAKYTILAVDDEETNFAALHNILSADYALYPAMSGEEALNMLENIKPDLVLLDILMPDLDGFEVLKRMKANLATANIPVIVVSALTGDENERSCYALGASDYISKPFNAETVRTRVETHIRIARHTESLSRWGLIDKTTGVADSRAFEERADAEWDRALKEHSFLSVITLGVDRFRHYSNSYGRDAGDAVLRTVAKLCSAYASRPANLVARTGDSKFTIILPQSLPRDAKRVAEAIRRGVATAVIPADRFGNTAVTVSLGVASVIPTADAEIKSLLDEAAGYMRDAKRFGRNRVRSKDNAYDEEQPPVEEQREEDRHRWHLFIINARTFRQKPDALQSLKKQITDVFAATGENYKIYETRYSRDAVVRVRDYAANVVPAEDIVRVYAVGGDGILFDCLNGMVGINNAELAPVPYGSQNSFVRNFGADAKEKFRDIAALASAPTKTVDVLLCAGNYAISDCCVGVEAAATIRGYELSDDISRIGWIAGTKLVTKAYVLGGLLAMFDPGLLRQQYTAEQDGLLFQGRYAAFNISNCKYYAETLAPNFAASPTDGLMDVLTTKGLSPLRMLSVMSGYLKGRWVKKPKIFKCERARRITISSETPMIVVLDGEIFYETSITVEVIPDMVRVVAPEGTKIENERDDT
ncbi:hypothetical protein FACS1894217_08720 [Clostridia bacterium]|nr:hypothetical protein FACS1894217_08720 [Clostridia bacterium]